MTDPESPLTLLTFTELCQAVERSLHRATGPRKRRAWAKLRDLAEEMRAQADATDELFTAPEPWRLLHVSVTGYQGAAVKAGFRVNPAPGITVVHGPNGSGKSTIAGGIRTALAGTTRWWTSRERISGRSGRQYLWEPLHRAVGAPDSSTEVHLGRGAERLVISAVLDADGEVVEHTCHWTTADGTSREVNLVQTSWRHALEAHPPVFSYADVERRVQQSGDLREYIENLLALGGCFEMLNDRVARERQASAEAHKRLEQARKAALERLREIDEKWTEGRSDEHLTEITWPDPVEDIEAWLEENGLTEYGGTVPEVVPRHLEVIDAAVEGVRAALCGIDERATSERLALARPLAELHAHAHALSEVGSTCPLCDTDVEDWRERLGTVVGGLVEVDPAHEALRRAVTRLVDALGSEFEDVVGVLASFEGQTTVPVDHLRETRAAAELFLRFVENHGRRDSPTFRRLLTLLHGSLSTDTWRMAGKEAVSLSEHARQWRRERRQAVDGFVRVWRADAVTARDHELWGDTRDCVTHLAGQLRDARTESLTPVFGEHVRSMLSDARISLDGLRLTSLRAEAAMSGASGSMQLNMLSAGQRNAFLLAPLLSTLDAGPFGFLILDDPVHAFDEIRIDRLSQALARVSRTRRVVVFTHDERLKEHLMARASNFESWAITREPSTGLISLDPTHSLWALLLDDASHICRLSTNHPYGCTLTVTQTVRGLCRQALDNALRQCLVIDAVASSRDIDADLAAIDGRNTTQQRLDTMKTLLSESAVRRLSAAEHMVHAHLAGWNRASHGRRGEAGKEQLAAEIAAAREACALLVAPADD
ncbi:ATP-binding protein [Allostreptomyces psammosilenae]|uniref:ABC-type transport system involved in cytochrome c biogenesis ATPase subunit n=1 Tax=Allostreptomyces psammosilenae TaxID=1892865 RepID=A0A853ABD1_9ACTN|nr:ATP-binding protein [Allostreptomyces psammosilenae]NYI07798.1 ABC-type transport system involved in cytochrome c biogenesis ATPase subunit [Allostreptomyces psammosilenae]